MKILSIEKITKTKSRISFESGEAIILNDREIRMLHLADGEDISEQAIDKLYNEVLLPKAKYQAMNLLKVQDRSEKEMRMRLKRNGYPSQIIEQVIRFLYSYHYLDDKRYTEYFLRYRSGLKSRKEILYQLSQKGIDADALENMEDLPSDIETIRRLIEKKIRGMEQIDRKEREKLVAYLARKGFCSSDIFSVLKELDN